MKQGWIGVVAGLAIGLTAVFMSQRSPSEPPPRGPGNGAELTTRCMAPLWEMYDRAAAPLRSNIVSQPSKALEAAQGQVANVVEIRLGVCRQALAARQSEKQGSAGSDVHRDISRLTPFVEKLSVARTRLQELIATLRSPQASDAQQKLDALDAAMRDATGSAH